MTYKEYAEWHEAYEKGGYHQSRILKGIRDDIHIIAIPTGRKQDRYIEGFVVRTGTPLYPNGYVSLAWIAEAFEFDEDVEIMVLPK